MYNNDIKECFIYTRVTPTNIAKYEITLRNWSIRYTIN